MKSTFRVALTAFSISALAAFSVIYARPAAAGIVTVVGKNCMVSGGGTICGFVGGSTTSQGSMIYYDFVSTGSNKLIISEYYRLNPNGTLRSASTNARYNAGYHETSLNITGMNANSNAWDYVYAAIVGEAGSGLTTLSNIYGMTYLAP
jgi:hypothetical protein